MFIRGKAAKISEKKSDRGEESPICSSRKKVGQNGQKKNDDRFKIVYASFSKYIDQNFGCNGCAI